ncbi:MAG: class I SAM-dependent methyltransferase [Gammaproteobacteria bacterium]
MINLGNAYRTLYGALSGKHPDVRPWHHQWLATKYLYHDLRAILPRCGGKVLDVGCGDKPYKIWFGHTEEYIGIDIYPGAAVDFSITNNGRWPLEDHRFDTVICTQVFEHIENIAFSFEEIKRVMKPNGVLILSVPFIYNEHGIPQDYRRFSYYGVHGLLEKDFDITCIKKQGGIGSTIAVLFLNWVDLALDKNLALRVVKGVGLPLFILISFLSNAIGWFVDKFDCTGAFYSNLLAVARKK